ncbi:MAG: carboxypeptidase-like regulatory domain-containing protein [Planctomycetota bacterium]
MTDGQGIARFDALQAGAYQLSTLWNHQDEARRVRTTVDANATASVTMKLAPGLAVEGRVTDDGGDGVANASIWLAAGGGGWASGAVVTTADARGHFRLRDVPRGVSLGALAKGHLPSALVDLDVVDTTSSPVTIDLVVPPGGGTVTGLVSDEEGRPVVGALVVAGKVVGDARFRFDGTVSEPWTESHTTTDEEGRYQFDVLRPGQAPVHVRADGFAQWEGEIDVPLAGSAQLDIRLERGTTVTGLVTDALGVPVAGARIQAFLRPLRETFLQMGQVDFEGPIAQEVALSGADGTYTLSPLPLRVVHLYALQRRPERDAFGQLIPFVHIELDLRDGAPRTWDPILSKGRTIRGLVRYQNGPPLRDVFVEAMVTAGADAHQRVTHTLDGTFEFIQLPGEAYTIRAQVFGLPQGHAAPQRTNVSPDGEPIELIATFDAPEKHESSEVSVRFEDTAGRAIGATPSVSLERIDRFARHFGERDVDGVWRFDLDEPGSFRPIALVGERVIAMGETFDFMPGNDLDLGTLRTEPGSVLIIDWSMPGQRLPEGLMVYLQPEGTRTAEELTPPLTHRFRFESLQPGAGKLTMHAQNMLEVELDYELVAGEETVLDVALVPAVAVRYRIDLPTYEDAVSFACRIIDASTGNELQNAVTKDFRRYPNPVEWSRQLTPGTYRLEASLGNGRHADTVFSVHSLEPTEAPTPALDLR